MDLADVYYVKINFLLEPIMGEIGFIKLFA